MPQGVSCAGCNKCAAQVQMDDKEWAELTRRRQQCLDFLAQGSNRCGDWPARAQEVREIEALLAELWKRLGKSIERRHICQQCLTGLTSEMDARKGGVAEPLQEGRSLADRWFAQALAPLLCLHHME